MDRAATCIAKPDRAGIRARRASRSVAAAITIGLLAGGCASSFPTRTGTSRTTAALEFAKCMRAHGVPNLPDPGARVSGPYNSVGGIAIPSTIDIHSPAFQAAENSCRGLLSAVLSPQGKPAITASLKAALIAHAQCMRDHGVPGYQDPSFPATGGIAITDAGTNPNSPAYEHAESVCRAR